MSYIELMLERNVNNLKIKYFCPRCLEENFKEKNTAFISFDSIDSVDLIDNYHYSFICKNGHENSFFIQTPRYELLYDLGLNAYLRGFYREAVLDFAACIERFHEYCIFALLTDNDLSRDDIRAFWSQISRRSEQQYGAFITLYLSVIKQLPVKQTNKFIEFRNDVTHKGKFPSKMETEQYAKYVAEYVCKIFKTLPKNDNPFPVLFFAMDELEKKKMSAGGHNIITALSAIQNGASFEKASGEFLKYYNMFYD